MAKNILLLNGPNLNLLGTREPDIYGRTTLDDIVSDMRALVEAAGGKLSSFQSNHEGEIIDKLHEARGRYDYIILNAGAYTHYSIAIRDALAAIEIPTIEVHISNIHQREEFRHHSVIAPVVVGQICGFGLESYKAALYVAVRKLQEEG